MSVFLYLSSIFLGLGGGIFYALRFNEKHQKSDTPYLILGLLVFVTCFELYAIYLVETGRYNVIVYNICFYYLETFILLGYFYAINLSKTIRRSILYFSVIYLTWGVVNTLFIQDIRVTMHNYSFLIASLGILTFCLLFLFGITKHNKYFERPLWTIPHFWNTSVLLIFYSSAFLFFISLNFLNELDPQLVEILGAINRTVAGIMYIVLGFSHYTFLLQPTAYAK
jgi:hypothetical protein